MWNTLFSVDAIFTGKFKQYKKTDNEYKLFESKINREESDEQSDTTEMYDLESEESQQGKGLKMLASNQMLSRLPISLAQLKAGIDYNDFVRIYKKCTRKPYSFWQSILRYQQVMVIP